MTLPPQFEQPGNTDQRFVPRLQGQCHNASHLLDIPTLFKPFFGVGTGEMLVTLPLSVKEQNLAKC